MFPIQGSDLLLSLGVAVIPAVIAGVLAHFTRWPRRRIVLVSAAPIPALAALVCISLIIIAATSSKASCGVDACGMMIAASISGLFLALFAFVICLGLAVVGFRVGR
jgi:hypothetical protein